MPKPAQINKLEKIFSLMEKYKIDSVECEGIKINKRIHIVPETKNDQVTESRDIVDPVTQTMLMSLGAMNGTRNPS